MIYQKIDAHSHFGSTYLGPISSISGYKKKASQIGITDVIASPGPSPEYILDKNIYRPCIWKKYRNQIIYVQQIYDNTNKKIIREMPANRNPYAFVNRHLLKQAKIENLKSTPRIHVMPLHHPLIDTDEEIEEMISLKSTIAIKVHGVATHTSPKNIRETVLRLLKSTNKPLVVHTDTFTEKPTAPIHNAYIMNNPESWVKLAIDKKIKILINHGARLSKKAINLAKNHDNVKIGCSPDLLIMSEPKRLASKTNDFIMFLLRSVPSNQILFDIDYGWNVGKRNDWKNTEWKIAERIETVGRTLGLKTQQLTDIYYNNALTFFNFKIENNQPK